MIKYVLIVTLLNGNTYQWGYFKTEVEAECHKTQLFDWNRKKGLSILRKRGFDIPTNWDLYNKKVYVKPLNEQK